MTSAKIDISLKDIIDNDESFFISVILRGCNLSHLTVELAEEVDREGVDLAIECLEQAFKVNQSSSDDQIPYGSLPEIFEKYCSLDKPGRSTLTCNSETISKVLSFSSI